MAADHASAVHGVQIRAYRIRTDLPEADGTLSWDSTPVLVVGVCAGATRGLGFSYAPRASARLVADTLADTVIGCDPMDVAGAWLTMVRAVRNDGRPGIVSMAIAAVDVALWDLKARLLDLPLASLLGRTRESVPVYGSGGFTSYSDAELTAQLGRWVHEDRIPRVKMKIGTDRGHDEAADLRRVEAARASIGDADLFVDANGAYSRKQAVRLAARFADLGVTWFEEPVSSDDLDGLHEVREATSLDVAAGEYGYALAYFEQMCAAQAVDVLQADVSRCAGITEWMRVSAVAAAHGLELSGHCAPSLHLPVALSVPNVRHVEYFHDHARVDRLLFDGVRDPVEGELSPALDRPGTGLELKERDAQPFLVHSESRGIL
jgi:L-alanine-DL-glutamate epimerase-like enolase superfamily enzyme